MEIKQDPSLAEQQPYKAILERDQALFQGVANQEPAVITSLFEAFGRSWAGTTPAQFEAQVREWMAVARQPQHRVSYLDLVLPADAGIVRAVEGQRVPGARLLGGGRGFIRVFAEVDFRSFRG